MFRVRRAQLAVFSKLARERFERELAAHLRETLPERCAALGDEGVGRVITRAIDRGKGYGFVTEQQVCLFATLMCLLHPELDEDPELGWVQAILNDKHHPYPDARLDALFEAWEERYGGDGELEEDGDEAEGPEEMLP